MRAGDLHILHVVLAWFHCIKLIRKQPSVLLSKGLWNKTNYKHNESRWKFAEFIIHSNNGMLTLSLSFCCICWISSSIQIRDTNYGHTKVENKNDIICPCEHRSQDYDFNTQIKENSLM